MNLSLDVRPPPSGVYLWKATAHIGTWTRGRSAASGSARARPAVRNAGEVAWINTVNRGEHLARSFEQIAKIPPEAWTYKLGNRSALEWILDQYKEKKPKDPTIRVKFNTYRFADYKGKVIDLLARVIRASMEMQAIVETMKTASR